MSDTRFAPVDAPAREESASSSKRWRNSFHSKHEAPVFVDGVVDKRGPGIFWGPNAFETEGEAVAAARAVMAEKNGAWATLYEVTYRGAFQVGDAP